MNIDNEISKDDLFRKIDDLKIKLYDTNDALKSAENRIKELNKCNDYANEELDQYKNNIDKAIEYIEKYLHEHVIDEYPDEQSTFYDENDRFIPNAKEVLLNILKGED